MGYALLIPCAFTEGQLRGTVLLVFLFELATARLALPQSSQSWVAQGPGPSLNGQTEGIGDNPVAGAINALALTADPNVLYVGTVNGGVWKTANAMFGRPGAMFQRPTWTPLTDLKLPALSINSLAVSPTDDNTLFAGTGSTSAIHEGSPGVGIAKSTDGGNTWSLLSGETFKGKAINSIVPTNISGGQVVLAATLNKSGGGVYRSTNAGETFTRISGTGGLGLPDAGVSSLVADPGNNMRFYAAVPSLFLNSGNPGIYVSTDGGVTWGQTHGEIPAGILEHAMRILLSVSGASPNPVYAMFIADDTGTVSPGRASGVFRSADTGATWIDMGVPTPDIFPGGQGDIHGAIVASPSDPNIVWVGGDRQGDFPEAASPNETVNANENGCHDASGSIMRGDFSVFGTGVSGPFENPWSNAVCHGASGSSPHADARAMVFDQNGNLLLANDAGISRLVSPESPESRIWVDVGGNIQPTEMHSIAYDSLSHVLLAGTQDTGTPMQSASGSIIWGDFTLGDGGVVAVDADQTRHPGISFRYTSNYQLGNFSRSVFDSRGNLVDQAPITLWIVSGKGSGQRLLDFDGVPFYTRYALNRIDPGRMLIGGSTSLYESFDRGDTLTNLGPTGGLVCALSYGGRSGGVDSPDILYAGIQIGTGGCGGPTGVEAPPTQILPTQVGTGAIFHRSGPGGQVTQLPSYKGGPVVSLSIDPQNFKRVFAVDNRNHVWGSSDEGENWTDLTGNLTSMTSAIQSVEVFGTDPQGTNTVLMAGTMNGVFQMKNPGPTGSDWSLLGESLPHALAYDIHYDYTDHVLVAGTLGRGAWILNNPFSQVPLAGARSTALETRINVAPVKPLLRLQAPPPVAVSRRH